MGPPAGLGQGLNVTQTPRRQLPRLPTGPLARLSGVETTGMASDLWVWAGGRGCRRNCVCLDVEGGGEFQEVKVDVCESQEPRQGTGLPAVWLSALPLCSAAAQEVRRVP